MSNSGSFSYENSYNHGHHNILVTNVSLFTLIYEKIYYNIKIKLTENQIIRHECYVSLKTRFNSPFSIFENASTKSEIWESIRLMCLSFWFCHLIRNFPSSVFFKFYFSNTIFFVGYVYSWLQESGCYNASGITEDHKCILTTVMCLFIYIYNRDSHDTFMYYKKKQIVGYVFTAY